MKLLFASTNPHKCAEIRALLHPTGIEILGLENLEGRVIEPEESGQTLEENARIKATAYAQASGLLCLADDSGLCVEALSGAPGVLSARYAGVSGPREERDRANREKLLRAMESQELRAAELVCTLCVAEPSGAVVFESRGSVMATILREERGSHGFGYDTLLFVERLDRCLAEVPPEVWNQDSHRARAVRPLLAWLVKRGVRTSDIET